MAIPTQGGLSQASQPPAGNKFDAGAAQADNLEEIAKSKPTSLKDTTMTDLGDQREALNNALLRMRLSLDERKNRMFDPVLMQVAAGFLKPTKTGSFGESLGYAAENAGVASEREMLHDKENQKLEMELTEKEMGLRQQMGGDQLIRGLTGQLNSTAAPTTAPTSASIGQPSPVAPNQQQVLSAAAQGKMKITDELLLLASRVSPKLLPTLQEIRKAQEGEEKNAIERTKLETTTRKVIPRGGRTEREMTATEYANYQANLKQYLNDGDEQKLLKFYDSMGYLEPEQVRGRQIAPTGGSAQPIGQAQTLSETELMKEKNKLDVTANAEVVKGVLEAGRGAYTSIQNADQIYRLANDPKTKNAFGVLQQNNIQSAILGAIAEGIQTQNGSIKFGGIEDAVRKIGGTQEEINAALYAARSYADLELNYARTYLKGQGAVSNMERVIVGKIGGSLSDTALVASAKAELVKARGNYDKQVSDLYHQWEKENPNKMYKDFERNAEFTGLQKTYDSHIGKLNDKYFPSSQPTNPTVTEQSPMDKFKQEKAARTKAAQGGQ